MGKKKRNKKFRRCRGGCGTKVVKPANMCSTCPWKVKGSYDRFARLSAMLAQGRQFSLA